MEYYYNVRTTMDEAVSPYSGTVKVTSLLETAVDKVLPDVSIRNTGDGILLSGVSRGDLVRVYSLTGILLYQEKSQGDLMDISLLPSNIYILTVQSNDTKIIRKVIR